MTEIFDWGMCQYNSCTHAAQLIVADEYFPADDPLYRFPICRSCYRKSEWFGVDILATRRRVMLSKRNQCRHRTGNECHRNGVMFILVQGKRRHLCVNHASIHSAYTEVYRINRQGMMEETTEELLSFYENHVRNVIVKGEREF